VGLLWVIVEGVFMMWLMSEMGIWWRIGTAVFFVIIHFWVSEYLEPQEQTPISAMGIIGHRRSLSGSRTRQFDRGNNCCYFHSFGH